MGDNTGKEAALARKAGAKSYFTGRPCKHGHVAWRVTRTGNCIECHNAKTRQRAKSNPALIAARLRKWRAEHNEHYSSGRKKYLSKTRDRINALARKRKRENPNYRARMMARIADKALRTTVWADKAKIMEFYSTAAELSRLTGIQHEVDHIIPLHGRLVSGLHVENNLQVLTRSANASKGNRFKPILE